MFHASILDMKLKLLILTPFFIGILGSAPVFAKAKNNPGKPKAEIKNEKTTPTDLQESIRQIVAETQGVKMAGNLTFSIEVENFFGGGFQLPF